MIGDLSVYGTVWFDGLTIANVLSLSRATCHFQIQFGNWKDNNLSLLTQSQTVILQKRRLVLYYNYVKHWDIMMVNMFTEKREGFTNREFEGAQVFYRSLRMLGFTS